MKHKSLLLILMLALSALAAVAQTATITTDEPDYAPGSTATFTGSGFQAGETVHLQVTHADETHNDGEDHDHWHVIADENGGFVTQWHVCEDDCYGSLLKVTAVGGASSLTAEAIFRDAQCSNFNITGPVSKIACQGSQVIFSVTPTLTGQGGVGNFSYQWHFNGAPINGATSSSYTVQNASAANAGEYYCIVINKSANCDAREKTSNEATLSILQASDFSISLTNTTLCEGSSTTLKISGIAGSSVGYTVNGSSATANIGQSGMTNINTLALTSDTNYALQSASVSGCSIDLSAIPAVSVTIIHAPVISIADVARPNDAGSCNAIVSYSPSIQNQDNVTYSLAGATTGSGAGSGSGLAFNKGTTTVTLVASNSCFSTNKSFNVTVNDDEAPVPPDLTELYSECGITVDAPHANDNCEGSVTGTTDAPSTYTEEGTFFIEWTFTDESGNVSTKIQKIVVDDVSNPVPDVETLPAIIAECHATVSGVPTATDNCAGGLTATTTDPLTYSALGTYTVNWKFDDGNGNWIIQPQAVIVQDTQAPVADEATLGTIVAECSAVAVAPTATDECAGVIVATTTDATEFYTQGTHYITWYYDDGNGNVSSQIQSIIIQDLTAPEPDGNLLPTVVEQCYASVSAPSATDNCLGTVTATTTDPTEYSSEGTYTIHWIYDDGHGNITIQEQTVIIDDTEAPVADLELLPVVSGECSAAVVTAPAATDNCVGSVTGTTTDPLTYSAQGTYTITWRFDDGLGNTSTQTQTVVVDDVTAPVADVAELPVVAGECSATVTPPTASDNCEGIITASTSDPLTYTEQGTYSVTWVYDDGNGNTSSQIQIVVVDDVTAPVPNIADLPLVSGECSASVTAPTALDNCEGTITATTSDPTSYSAQGTYTVNWVYDDGNGNTSTQTQTVVVDDTTPPSINNMPSDITVNNDPTKCGAVVTYNAPTASDNCSGVTIARTQGPASGALFPIGTTVVEYTATDVGGNTATSSFRVTVNNPAPVLGTPVVSASLIQINSTTTLTVPYNDLSSVTMVITWDDGSTTTKTGVINGSVTESHKYTATGVYAIGITVIDECNTSLTASTVYQYIVVYDPTGGFVTGGGWINSPAGAYPADPTMTGKANFGFVSKYQKGATIPSGDTEFQFHAGSLNFKSTSYEWLVVAGTKAQFKGKGTINGSGNYSFLISAIDGSPDKFRIKITNGTATVYDNQLGAADNADAVMAIAGGSIVVHDAKAKSAARDAAEVVADVPGAAALTVYPNPVDETILISYKSESMSPILFNLIDMNGRSLTSVSENVNSQGQYEVPVGGLSLRSGFYFLKVAQDHRTRTVKILKK